MTHMRDLSYADIIRDEPRWLSATLVVVQFRSQIVGYLGTHRP